MSRNIREKELIGTRLANNYGGWIYCNRCNENIGFLCYATYDEILLKYRCQCGNQGKIRINFEDSETGKQSARILEIIRNRLCCPENHAPLITILENKISNYHLEITCQSCHSVYMADK